VSRTPQHHPIFDAFTASAEPVDRRFDADFLGVLTRREFFASDMNVDRGSASEHPGPRLPRFDGEYHEWIDVLEAVADARRRFVMFELGAGFGRWLVRGAAAARQRGVRFSLVGVEAEPTHFRWMQQHFRDNGVRRWQCRLVRAAVAAEPGWLTFHVGDPAAWYGQAIDANVHPIDRPRLKQRLFAPAPSSSRETVPVRAVVLRDLLKRYRTVDLIDLDVQGVEADVLESAARELATKVKRVHVGTHSADVEERLRVLFGRLGWLKRNDYPCLHEADTPYGRIAFQDGVQTWLNPRLSGE